LRPAALIVLSSTLFLVSCGYVGCGQVGPIVPPSPEIPPAIRDLAVVERGSNLVITFTVPARTTDNVAIKRFSEIDLRVGPYGSPFDFEAWADSASRYELTPPPGNDPDNPLPSPMTHSIPADSFVNQHIAVGVRTAVKKHNHFSSWSNVVRLEVIPPLQPPVIKAEPSGEGMRITWPGSPAGLQHRILRQGPNDKAPVEIGSTDKAVYVDRTSQYNTAYTYQAVAVKGTAESLVSQPVTVSAAENVDRFPPRVPVGVTALATSASIEVSWERDTDPDLKGYYVYRSVNGGVYERQGGLVTLPTYSDTHVEHGKLYRYDVSAVDQKGNESNRSAGAQVSF
jgi:hypothetical protein